MALPGAWGLEPGVFAILHKISRRRDYTVHVKELCYPGRPGDVKEANGKWVYAFRDGKLAVEAKCFDGDMWDGWTIKGQSRKRWGSARGIRLDPGPKGQRYTYAYLLSPVQLTQECIDDIEKGVVNLAAAECACDRYDKTVYAPDPFQWACDAHQKYFAPRLEALRTWRYDENLVAYDFVARVLKAWIDDGDSVGAKNELKRQPDDWLNARNAGLGQAQRLAEEAAAYVAQHVDSPEYLVVEKACRLRGGEELELAAVCLASATENLSMTEPGRHLAQRLAANPERVPGYFIFQDKGPRLPDEWFARFRYGQKGLLGLFQDLLPAWVQRNAQSAEKAVAKETAAEEAAFQERYGKNLKPEIRENIALKNRARVYLENLGARTKLRKRRVALLDNLRQNRPVIAGTRRNSLQWQKMPCLVQPMAGWCFLCAAHSSTVRLPWPSRRRRCSGGWWRWSPRRGGTR
jgi:hypothetical protein